MSDKDIIEVEGEVTELLPKRGQVTLNTICSNQAGEQVMTGVAVGINPAIKR